MIKRWLGMPALILISAFATNGIIMLVCGYNPLEAYAAAVGGAFGNGRKLGETLVKSTPFLMAGLSVAVAFRCGIWNIGAEGQFLIGALAATWFRHKTCAIFSCNTVDSRAAVSLPRRASRGHLGPDARVPQSNARRKRSHQHDYAQLRCHIPRQFHGRQRAVTGGVAAWAAE